MSTLDSDEERTRTKDAKPKGRWRSWRTYLLRIILLVLAKNLEAIFQKIEEWFDG